MAGNRVGWRPRSTLAAPLVWLLLAAGSTPLLGQVAGGSGTADGDTVAASGSIPGFAAWLPRTLDRVVEDALAGGASPGAALVIGHGGGVVYEKGWGRLDPGEPGRVSPETVYDLASVTKVAATTVAVMLLVEEGRLDLDRPLADVLDGWPEEGDRGAITPRHLLTHTSGLPAGAPFWRDGVDRSSWVRALAEVPLEASPGRREIYSDLGPILLGFLVETVSGEPLDRFVARRVYGPLGMASTGFHPGEAGVPVERIAPTERLAEGHLRGVVHDPSARALGGVAGNAGLFASARDLAVLASALLWEEPARLVCRDLLRRFASRSADRERFGLGWEMPPRWAFWSEVLSEHAFGHTGFTGTSLWIDPAQDLFVVLLTNRVNPTSENEGHRALRREVHDAVARAHLDEEGAVRAADWRTRDHWTGVDGCRADEGMRLLRERPGLVELLTAGR